MKSNECSFFKWIVGNDSYSVNVKRPSLFYNTSDTSATQMTECNSSVIRTTRVNFYFDNETNQKNFALL